MSIWQLKSPGLSISPRVEVKKGALRVSTSWVWKAVSLGSYQHRVTVDVHRREVEVETRRFWLWTRTERLSFDDIEFLGYEFSDLARSFFIFPGYYRRLDTVESYRVYLGLPGDRQISVGTFRGEGSVMNGAGFVLLGIDDAIDMVGTQGDDSLALVDQLAHILEVPVGRPLLNQRVVARICEDCRRAAPAGQRACLYCGGAIISVDPMKSVHGAR